MMRRGQVALEFLTTYGWAFLIILIMIGAISYFGILNPSKLLPSKCTIGSELHCNDFQIDSATDVVSIDLKQGVGKTIYPQTFDCTYEGVDSNPGTWTPAGATWSPKDAKQFDCGFAANTFAGLQGEKIKVTFEFVYRKSASGFDHLVAGEVYTDVK